MDGVTGWLSLRDRTYISVILPISFISIISIVVLIVCVACCCRPRVSKPPSPPQQRACSAPTTSSVTTTTYLPGVAASTGLDEYTRCFVAPPRLNGSAGEWTVAGSPSVTVHGGGMKVGPPASPAMPPLMSAAPPAMHSDVQYRFYEEC